MRTDRPYRKALDFDLAVAELMSGSGAQLDPAIVDVLMSIVTVDEAPKPVAERRAERPRPARVLLPGTVQAQGSE
jgi:HD-GYP domain-containing protein (c-di-GMP phosphodiesterase class II)